MNPTVEKYNNKNKFFDRLQTLFGTSILLKTKSHAKIRNLDIEKIQSKVDLETNRFVDKRYARAFSKGYMLYGNDFINAFGFQTSRTSLYKDYECISGDTIIPLPNGEYKTMEELSKLYPNRETKFYIYSYDLKSKTVKLGEAHSVRKTKTELTYKVTFDDGNFVKATCDHPFLMRNGEYTKVKDLKLNDEIQSLYFPIKTDNNYNRKTNSTNIDDLNIYPTIRIITSIEPFEEEEVYDMTVNEYHNFATQYNIISNSMDRDSRMSSAIDLYSDECLNNQTVIKLCDGTSKTIEELYNENYQNFYVYSLNSQKESFGPSLCERVAYNGKKEMVEIELEDTTIIKCTLNHIWINNETELKSTQDLKVGDSFLVLKDDNTNFVSELKILSIKSCGLEDAYDLVNVGNSHIYGVETKDNSIVFCHNCTTKNEYNEILSIHSENSEVQDSLYNLFYDILNVEFNLWPWTRMLCKYGDLFLKLDIMEKIGIINAFPLSPYAVSRLEDPSNPDNIVFRYDNTLGTKIYVSNSSTAQKVFQNYEIAHFRLLSDTNFAPYGKSILENARKTWKQILLLEDAMMIQRIMRAPERRIIKIDVGNIPPNEVESYMNTIIERMKKIPYIDETTGDYDLRFNLMPIAWYSKIQLTDNRIITIKELSEEIKQGKINYVYSIDKNNDNKIVEGKVTWCDLTIKDSEILRIHLNDSSYLDVEPSHPIMLKTGEYIKAKDLKLNDSIMPFIYNSENNNYENDIEFKVIQLEQSLKKEDVYCMTVEDYHNFAVVTHKNDKNGIFVKNSSLEDFYLPIRGGNSGTEIDTLPGMEFTGIEDIEYLNRIMLAGLRIPKAFLTMDETLQGKCLDLNTEIKLINNKSKTLHQLIEDYNNDITNFVYSYDINSHTIEIGEIEFAGITRINAEVIKIKLNIDIDVICTPDHKFLTQSKGYVEAQYLETNDYIIGFLFNNIGYPIQIYNYFKIQSIEKLEERIDTGDITIKDYHNFALSSGLFVHNSTLSGEDVRFSRSVERVQRVLESELNKIAIIHLYTQGFSDEDLTEFELKLTISSKIAEQEKLEILAQKITQARDLKELKMFSSDYIYTNIFQLSEDEYKEEQEKLIGDLKYQFRLNQIEQDGNDPATTHEKSKEDEPSEDMTEEGIGKIERENPEERRKRLIKKTYSNSLTDALKRNKKVIRNKKLGLLDDGNLLKD
jgi:hypothetical protein